MISELLDRGAAFERRLPGAADPLAEMGQFDRTTLEAERDRLMAVDGRCVLSGLQRRFLDRVLAQR